MKKVLFLLCTMICFMSVSDIDSNFTKTDTMVHRTCCTATVTYYGNPVTSITRCTTGTGGLAEAIACSRASAAANDYIKKAKAAVQAIEDIF